jgi:hypothetical protein
MSLVCSRAVSVRFTCAISVVSTQWKHTPTMEPADVHSEANRAPQLVQVPAAKPSDMLEPCIGDFGVFDALSLP